MKKGIFLIAILMAVLIACVPAPVKSQTRGQHPVLGFTDLHQYDVATPTTPIGRHIVANDKLWVKSTGQILLVTAAFDATATPATIVTSGSYKYFPSGNGGLNTLVPTATGLGSVGTASLKWGTGYINALTSTTVTATGAISTSGSGYLAYGSVWLQDSVSYFPSRTSGAGSWLAWQLRQAGTPKCRMTLQNMADYSMQNKAGTGQIPVMTRDTVSAADVTAQVKNVSHVILTAVTDTTTKTAGAIVYIGGFFFGCNGTYYYKLTN